MAERIASMVRKGARGASLPGGLMGATTAGLGELGAQIVEQPGHGDWNRLLGAMIRGTTPMGKVPTTIFSSAGTKINDLNSLYGGVAGLEVLDQIKNYVMP